MPAVEPTPAVATPSAWAPIPESDHEASDTGQVRHGKTKRILQATFDRDGYRVVNLLQGGARRPHAVHRLVLLAFVGPPPTTKHQAAHNDGDRANNSVWNLSWVTPIENGRDRRRHNRIRTTIRTYAVVNFRRRRVGRIETDRYVRR